MQIVSYSVYLDIIKGHHRCTDYGVEGFFPGTGRTYPGTGFDWLLVPRLDSKW